MDTQAPQTTRGGRRRRTTDKAKTGTAASGKAQAAAAAGARAAKTKAATRRSPAPAKTSVRPAGRSRATGVSNVQVVEPIWGPTARTEFLLDTLAGVTELAEMLGVSKSQPTRWRQGSERPSPAVARRLVDLEHVWARALQLWDEKTARVWLESSNAFLDGARPIDVLELRGASEVLDALDAAFSGAYA